MILDLRRLLEGTHSYDGNPITVKRIPPKEKVPLDPVRVHIQGLKETTSEDNVRNYLEKFCDQDVVKVLFGDNNNALVDFYAEPGIHSYRILRHLTQHNYLLQSLLTSVYKL